MSDPVTPAFRVTDVDHVVFKVADVERSVAWYRDELGLETVRLDEWRAGQAPFVSVRVGPGTILDLQQGEVTGVNVDHVALTVTGIDRDGLAALAESGRFGEVAPPRELFGARGVGYGIYVRDPDGHVIELRCYPAEGSAAT